MVRIWFLAVLAFSASAQIPLSEHEAVAQALSSHPLLAASTEHVAALQATQAQAGLRPNPRVYFQMENLRSYGSPGFNFGNEADTFGYLSQVFETAGKRSRRAEAAGAAVRKAALERELKAREIAGRVKLAYWNAASSRKLYELLRENAGTFRRIVEYHEARVREGATAEADLLRVRIENERLEIAANSARLEAERSRIHLFREMGQSEFPPVRFSDALESVIPAPEPDVSRALSARTEMRLAQANVEYAQTLLRLEKAQSTPDLDVLFGYKRTAGFHTMLGGLQAALPLSDRNQGNIAAAEREIKVAQSNLAATGALVRAEVQSARRDFEARSRQVSSELPALRDHAEETSRIALAAYREGGTDLLRLLDAEQMRIDTQLLYYRTLAEYQQSRVALEIAMGVEP